MPDRTPRDYTRQNARGGRPLRHEGAVTFAGNNPWILITSEEIGDIERLLYEVRDQVPVEYGHRVGKISAMMAKVRDRRA